MKKIILVVMLILTTSFLLAQMSTHTIKASFDPDNQVCAAADGSPRCLQYYGSDETWASAALIADSLATDTTLEFADSSGYTVGKHIYCEGAAVDQTIYEITANNTTTDIITVTPALVADCLIGEIVHEGADPSDATAQRIDKVKYHAVEIDITIIVSAEINLRVMCSNAVGTWAQVYPYTRLLALGIVTKRVEIPETCYSIVVGIGITTDAGTDAVAVQLDLVNYAY